MHASQCVLEQVAVLSYVQTSESPVPLINADLDPPRGYSDTVDLGRVTPKHSGKQESVRLYLCANI